MQQKARRKGIPWPAPSFFRVRPLLCVVLALILGIALSRALPYTAWLWAGVGGLAILAALLRGHRWAMLAALLAASALLGLARGGMALRVPDMPATGRWTAAGTVSGEVSHNGRAVMFYLDGVRVRPEGEENWRSIAGKVYCYYPTTAASRLAHGQRVIVTGTSYMPSVARNPGGFDQAMWLAQSGAHVRMYLSHAPQIEAEAGFSVKGLALAVKEGIGGRMDALFGPAAPVIRAMVLGDQRGMPDDWSQWMRDSGIAHLLAVSGLHVGLWFALLSGLLRRTPLRPAERWVLLAVLLACYALLTGLRASILRATVMLMALQGGHVARRKPDPLTNIALAAGCILCFRPLDLFGAGFQLSFCAVLGIVLLRPAVGRLLPKGLGGVGDALGMTLSAQLGILPASTRWFATVPLLGVLLNLAAIPLTGLLIPVAALATALDAIWAPLGWFFAKAAEGMVAALMLLAKAAAAMPLAYVRAGAFAWWTAAAYAAGMFLCCTAVVWKWRWRALAMGLCGVLALGMGYMQGSFAVRYVQLDVGQALAGVLHAGRGTYVYDTGDVGSDLTEYLAYVGGDVDALFLSHPHKDHVGGLEELLDAGIPVKAVFVPARADAFGADDGYYASLARAQAQGAVVTELAAGDRLDLSGVTATVIAPGREVTRGNDPNDRSLVLLLDIEGSLLLLMGDADGPAEPLGVDTDVLQVAHHGSRNAAREVFLRDATPDIALISTGRNSYGHPHPETLARLEAAQADIHITQESGALTLYFRPGGIEVEAYIQ